MFLPSAYRASSSPVVTEPIAESILQRSQRKLSPQAIFEDAMYNHVVDTGDTALVLPNWCKLGGQPYSLKYYPQFIPMFNLKGAPTQVWRCARQVGKSENLTASRYIRGRMRDNYNTLMVCPRYEQSRRLSVDKAAPLLRNSRRNVLIDKNCVQRAMEREMINGNKVQYTYCFTSPDAARGFSVQSICYDETQDIVLSFADIIDQCMSGSKIYYDKLFSGTPKETTGTLDVKFESTSQGYWATKCPRCNSWNIASDDVDDAAGLYWAELMIGPTGPQCMKCHKPLEDAPLRGEYVHRYPDRVKYAEGFHVPQVIHYAHWGSQTKWNVLLEFYKGNPITGKDPLPRVTLVNEILGIPMDSEEMLIKPAEIKRASIHEHNNELLTAVRGKNRYHRIFLGIDWSGFGSESQNSHTALSVIGESKQSGDPEVIYLEPLPKSSGNDAQIKQICELYRAFHPFAVVHDGGGAGAQQEMLLVKSRIIPADKIIGITYNSSPISKYICYPSTNMNRRGLMLDKTRSLLFLFLMMQKGRVMLPNYESALSCTNDFLAIYRDTRSSETGVSKLRILTKSGKSDDFCHSINMCCTYMWYRRNEYNEMTKALGVD